MTKDGMSGRSALRVRQSETLNHTVTLAQRVLPKWRPTCFKPFVLLASIGTIPKKSGAGERGKVSCKSHPLGPAFDMLVVKSHRGRSSFSSLDIPVIPFQELQRV